MKTKLPWIVAALQLALLAYMAGEREWVAMTGETVWLRTMPVDPRDPMRGDYVRLSYEISRVPRELCRDEVATWFRENTNYSQDRRDARVYAAVRNDEFGLAQIVNLSDRPPESGLFLRGRVDAVHRGAIDVRYGVEAMFMQQGTARALENQVRGERAGVPLNVRVAVGRGGLAVLRDYTWEPLGIQINVLTTVVPDDSSEEERRRFRASVTGAEVVLFNVSSAPVAIVDRPGGRSFRLVRADRWDRGPYSPVETAPGLPALEPSQVIVLAPGGSHVMRVDFARPEWFVVRDAGDGTSPGPPVPLGSLENEWNAWFRIEYAPPAKDECADLPDAELIAHRRLRSRAFNPSGGRVD